MKILTLRRPSRRPALFGLVMVGMLLFGLFPVGPLGSASPARAEDFANPAFEKLWKRTDGPVKDGLTKRSYTWGDQAFATKTERYDESPGQQRLVQYFDKGRMEITRPSADASNDWYVTSGLLVRDLAGGLVQVSDNNLQLYEPAQIPVVGDRDPTSNDVTPRYADFSSEVLSYRTYPTLVGENISATIKVGGVKGKRDKGASPQVKYGYYEARSGHNIADPFWQYFTTKGPIYAPATGATIEAELFNWQFVMGLPLTEPYWTSSKVDGKATEVLVQLFERRVLTYTPSNPEGFQVEMGNVGLHYYSWRYDVLPPIEQDLTVPASTNGSMKPTYGGIRQVFRVQAQGFKPNEKVRFAITQPDYAVLERSGFYTYADKTGTVGFFFSGSTFASKKNNGLGVYFIDLFNEQKTYRAIVYWRVIKVNPITPTTPYKVDRSFPPPYNASVEPGYGPGLTTHVALLNGTYLKELQFGKVNYFVTGPDGTIYRFGVGLGALDETIDGVVLLVGAPTTPGLWKVTFRESGGKIRSEVTIRVTEEPLELTLGAWYEIVRVGQLYRGSGLFYDDAPLFTDPESQS